MKFRPLFIVLSIALFFSIAGCSRQALLARLSIPTRLTVYTSIYPIYEFTKLIGKEQVNVVNIIPPGSDIHTYQPTIRLVAALAGAELFIYNGAGMEPYLDSLIKALKGSPLVLVDSSTGINLIASENIDPHLWLSPANAAKQGFNILQALIEADPIHREQYEANYQDFLQNLERLDWEYRKTISRCTKKDFIVSHPAFAYLARDYGLNQIYVAGLNPEVEPDPQTLAEIKNLVKRYDISYIYFDFAVTPLVSETMVREANTRALVLHTIESPAQNDLQAGQGYFSLMRENLESLKKSLDFIPLYTP